MYDLTLTLITYGSNPNVIIYDPSQRDDDLLTSSAMVPVRAGKTGSVDRLSSHPVSNLIIYYYVHLLMKKNQLWINDPECYFARILRLYYFAMNHAEVYACLRVLLAQTGMNPTKTALFSVIRDLHSKPRTLKQLARISIYNAIGQKPAFYANKLPLPPSLREYLVSFEP